MASFERSGAMYELRLKSKILRHLLSAYVPNEKQLLTNFQLISKATSIISSHKLLYETPIMDQKLQAKWKSAADDWVNRLLALMSSKMPDKCRVGILLMGITCHKCSTDSFVSSYSVWFNTLSSHRKIPASSRIVRVDSCISISDLLERLFVFRNPGKDAVSHAKKVILPIIRLLDEDSSEAQWFRKELSLCLVQILTLFPAAFHSNYDKKFAHFLALLPKAKGGSRSLMMQKLLISINVHLNDFLQGLEEETTGTKAIQRLVPPEKDPPLPFGGQNGGLEATACNFEHLVVTRVSALKLCTSTMLISSYKSKVVQYFF